ncbi:MAG TPA: hypothetical protein VGI65_12865 [Steroidobacteraceae bacterium]|jgi:hypothetical protein
MKIVCAVLLACGFMSGIAVANDAPASDASILEFLELTNAHQLVDGVKSQVDSMMDAAKQEALKGRPLTPERQQVLDHMVEKFRAASADMTNWDALLPMYMQMYRDTFTQDELDGAISFWQTCGASSR